MNLFRKLIATLLAGTLLLYLTACSGSNASKIKTETTIQWWVMPVFSSDGEVPFPEELAHAFIKENPKATVEITLLDPITAKEKLKKAAQSGEGPDVFFGDLSFLKENYGDKGYLSLSSMIEDRSSQKRSLPEDSLLKLGHLSGGDSLEFYPIVLQPYLMAFNKDMVSEAGVLEDLPLSGDRSWTMEEYTAFLKKLKEGLPKSKDTGIFFYGSPNGNLATMAMISNAYGGNPSLVKSPEIQKGLAAMQGLMKNNKLAEDAITIAEDHAQPDYLVNGYTTTGKEALDDFLSGQSAHTIYYSLDLDLSRSSDHPDFFPVLFMPYPRSEGNGGLPFELLGAAAMDHQNENRAIASRAFIDFLANNEATRSQICGYAGGISPNPEYNTFLTDEYAYLKETLSLLGTYHAYGYESTEDGLRWITLLRHTLFDGMSPEEAAALYENSETPHT